VPQASRPREQVENHGRACTQVLFLHKAELGFFHFLEIVTGWLVPCTGQKIPVAENRFLHAGKGAGNTNEKSRGLLYVYRKFHVQASVPGEVVEDR